MNDDESAVRHAKAEGRQELEAGLRALMQQWREAADYAAEHFGFNEANNNFTGEEGIVALRDCATEVEALLAGSDRPDSERP